MNARELKEQIIYDEKIRDVLVALGMKHIKEHEKYFSCGMPDGDNPSSTIIHKNNLYINAYTRNISDIYGNTDIISLVMYIKSSFYFSSALKWICEVCGYDYYGETFEKPEILNIFQELMDMRTNSNESEEEYAPKPVDEYLLTYYHPLKSKLFYQDGISYSIQRLFDIRFDGFDNRIVIPIRDENGVLVGIKGRLNYTDVKSFENKYIYLTECSKSSILFGLDLAYDHIKEKGIVYVAESEKAVMQAFSWGIKNVVAIGGKLLSRTQVKKLTYLGVEVCLCYDDKADTDSNGEIDTEFYKKQKNMFLDSIKVSHIIDKKREILGEKESPFDNMDMWEELLLMKKDIE